MYQRPAQEKSVCSHSNQTAKALQMAVQKRLQKISDVSLNWSQPKFAEITKTEHLQLKRDVRKRCNTSWGMSIGNVSWPCQYFPRLKKNYGHWPGLLRRDQRIHSSGLEIPVGSTCCMLLCVCERSLKVSAVFTKWCNLLCAHVTPTSALRPSFRRARRYRIPSDAPNWSKKWCRCSIFG